MCLACNEPTNADANSDQEAIEKLIAAGKEHGILYYTGMQPVSSEEMEAFVRSTFKKVELE
jgi:hypothetical protein